MSQYLYAIHDAGGEHLMADKPGWIVITEAIGSDANDRSGTSYRGLSNQGFTVIARLNNGYFPAGSIPAPSEYGAFAQRCANFVKMTQGCSIFIIANELNHLNEQIPGQPVTPAMYADCFNQCYVAIKTVASDAQVVTAPVAPWDASTKYPTNLNGDWIVYFADTLKAIPRCDAIGIHGYTHGPDAHLITSEATMDAPFQNRRFEFRTYLDFLAAVPPDKRNLPVYWTETDQVAPWADANTGWVQAAYAEVDRHNQASGTQKIHCLALYRWAGDKWEFASKNGVHADLRAAVAKGYKVPLSGLRDQVDQMDIHMPNISTGVTVPQVSLPDRQVDPRAAARGTVIETPSIASGQEYWRVKRLYTPNEDESDRLGPDRHILANVLSVNGGRQVDAPLLVTWGSGGPNERATIHTKKNDAFEFTADHALTPGTFTIEVIDGRPSERVVGIKMGANRADGSFNQNAHTSTLVDFELVTMPAVAVPTPVTPPPAPVEPPPTKPTPAWVTAPAGARLRAAPSTDSATLAIVKYGEEVRIIGVESILGWLLVRYGDQAGYMASRWIGLAAPEPTPEPEQPVSDNWNRAWPIVLKIEGGLSTDRSDKGNYRPDGTFVGTKWGISALSHPTVDIVNLTKEQALEIYHRNYWLGGGCDKLPWPLALLHFDAYVQNEVAAKKFLAASNGDPDLYMAERIDWYTRADTWDNHGRGWMRRCATMLREVAKSK